MTNNKRRLKGQKQWVRGAAGESITEILAVSGDKYIMHNYTRKDVVGINRRQMYAVMPL